MRRRKPGDGQCDDPGACAGEGDHGDAILRAQTHKVLAGVGYTGRTGIGNKSAALARGEACHYLGTARRFVVLMI